MKTMNVSVTEEQVRFIDKLVKKHDFANRSELVRLVLRRVKTNPSYFLDQEPAVQLSPKAIKRYNKMDEGIASGKEPVYIAKDVDDLLDQLHGRKSPVLAKVSETFRKKNRIKQKTVKTVRRASKNVYSKLQTSAS